jgi:hypothetical protein
VPYLQQGITPHKLALTVALGLLFGIFPILGTSTLLCTLIALAFRLNMAVIQLINYLVYPLQLLLLLPFIRIGEMIFQTKSSILSVDYLIQTFKAGWWQAMLSSKDVLLLGFTGWCLVALPLSMLVYYACLLIFKRLQLLPQAEKEA